MPSKKYIINLSVEEREALLKLVSTGKNKARRITRARALLLTDQGDTDAQIAHSLNLSVPTLERLRKRVLLEGAVAALDDHHRAGVAPKFDDVVEITMVAIACTKAPTGHARWSLKLIADKLVSLGIVESISPETVRQRLKKTNSSLGSTVSGSYRR